MKKIQTLCFLRKDEKILLGMKKRGFGAGRWNGFGGKVEQGETIEEAAKRETIEESGIKVQDLEKFGVVNFTFEGNEDILEVHFFEIKDYSGEPAETEEMKPKWFDFKDIPLDDMWPDDKFWMPLFLKNRNFKGNFKFDKRGGIVLENNLEVI